MSDPMRETYRELSGTQKRQIEEVKAMARHLYGLLAGIGDTREISLAKTKVEEAVMWAVKGITGKIE
jgi:phosphoribosylaminoimidazole-succinocarboxamide synthase